MASASADCESSSFCVSSGSSALSSTGRVCSSMRGARSQNDANAVSKTSMSSRRETIVQRSAQ